MLDSALAHLLNRLSIHVVLLQNGLFDRILNGKSFSCSLIKVYFLYLTALITRT